MCGAVEAVAVVLEQWLSGESRCAGLDLYLAQWEQGTRPEPPYIYRANMLGIWYSKTATEYP